jgi:hypothetical protein
MIPKEYTHISAKIRDTRPCASALRPCFMIKLVRSANTGSAGGGIDDGSYPLEALMSTIRGSPLDIPDDCDEDDDADPNISPPPRIAEREPKSGFFGEEADVDALSARDG